MSNLGCQWIGWNRDRIPGRKGFHHGIRRCAEAERHKSFRICRVFRCHNGGSAESELIRLCRLLVLAANGVFGEVLRDRLTTCGPDAERGEQAATELPQGRRDQPMDSDPAGALTAAARALEFQLIRPVATEMLG